MASSKKKDKKRKSKIERKKLALIRGRRSASKQGLGVGSRKLFHLPAKWREVRYKRGKETRVQFASPGKTLYKTHRSVKKQLLELSMTNCLPEEPTSECSSVTEESANEGDGRLENSKIDDPVVMEEKLFVCQSTQFMDFVEQINATSSCATVDCNGKSQEIYLFE